MRWWLLLGKKALLRRVFAAVIGVLFLCMLKWWWAIYKCVHDTTYNMVGYLQVCTWYHIQYGGLFTSVYMIPHTIWWGIYKCVHDTTYNMVGYLQVCTWYHIQYGGVFTHTRWWWAIYNIQQRMCVCCWATFFFESCVLHTELSNVLLLCGGQVSPCLVPNLLLSIHQCGECYL